MYLALIILTLEVLYPFIGTNKYYLTERRIFITRDPFRLTNIRNLWTYRPNAKLTTAATYQFSAIESWVEYRCPFETNGLGLIDTNYNPGDKVDYLVVGDSAMEGLGGCPWFTRQRLPKDFPVVLNGGQSGGSIESFALLDKWLAPQVEVRNMVMVVIGNDFKRMLSPFPIQRREQCLQHGRCSRDWDLWWTFEEGATDAELLAMAHKIFADGHYSFATQLHKTLRYHSLSYLLYLSYADQISHWFHPQPTWEQLFPRNFRAFRQLLAKYPNLKVVLLPQRDETGVLGSENFDTRTAKKFLEKMHVPYTYCPLTLDDFMPADVHPNRKGYDKLFTCVTQVIEEDRRQLTQPSP